MEKFAVDLDKVLDEFELDEDRASELIANRQQRTVLEFPKSNDSIRQQTLHRPNKPMLLAMDLDPGVALENVDLMADANFAVTIKSSISPIAKPVHVWSSQITTENQTDDGHKLVNGGQQHDEDNLQLEKVIENQPSTKGVDSTSFAEDLEGLLIPVLIPVEVEEQEQPINTSNVTISTSASVTELLEADKSMPENQLVQTVDVNLVGFEKEVEREDETVQVMEQSPLPQAPVTIVGFNTEVEVTDADLERYLHESAQSSEEYFTPTTEDTTAVETRQSPPVFATPSSEADTVIPVYTTPEEPNLLVNLDVEEQEQEVEREPQPEATVSPGEEDEELMDEDSGSSRERKPQRPTSLPLPNKIEMDPGDMEDYEDHRESPEDLDQTLMMLSEDERNLGRVAPVWVPDVDAPKCMGCDAKFTVIRRRHHCRACGRVLCAQCCGLLSRLAYMDNKKARVCQPCKEMLERVTALETGATTPVNCVQGSRSPNPNNPSEYCSTVPPMEQAQAYLNAPPPSVLVPVGVLKREGSRPRGEPKQVIFSDGIRPGGDLTELDGGDSEPRLSVRRHGRVQRRVDSGSGSLSPARPPRTLASPPAPRPSTPGLDSPMQNTSPVPSYLGIQEYAFDGHYDAEHVLSLMKDESAKPVAFLVHRNLRLFVKIVTMDCCTNCTCWCFTTSGLSAVGQDEIMLLLEVLPDEVSIPDDIFHYFNGLYEDAAKGMTVSNLGHTIFTHPFLGSRDHGGFLYIRPSFQCLQKVVVPDAPYLVAVLLQKWEVPWAKVFPIRLMLRLGAEFRYYPCPLTSVRNRQPVYCEIGHTIMNLLADFRNYQYMLPSIPGMVIHMEDNHTTLNFPRNRYDETMKALNNGGIDHVLALGGNFSLKADSHLVCIQHEEGVYQTQAINIKDRPRKVTGASFVVFNCALKTSSGLTAKSSIVEDGIMVQVLADTMQTLRQSLRDMKDMEIVCGPVGAEQPDEIVTIQWVEDDRHINVGVRSPTDGMAMDGIASVRIHCGTDYMSERHMIRWTEVFLIQTDELTHSRRSEPMDISKTSDLLAQSCCIALTPHLADLAEAGRTKIGLRVTLDAENVGYEVGAGGQRLPTGYMNDLDCELVPSIHRVASAAQESPLVLELIFHILEH